MFSLWAVYRSVFKLGESEFKGHFTRVSFSLLILLALSAFCELQPVIINWMYETIRTPVNGEPRDYSVWVKSVIAYLTPIIAVVSLYAKRIGEMLATESKSGTYTAIMKRVAGKAAIWAVALALPVVIWLVYCFLSIGVSLVSEKTRLRPGSGQSGIDWTYRLTRISGLRKDLWTDRHCNDRRPLAIP